MTRTLPEIGSKVQLAWTNENGVVCSDSGTANKVEVLGPSVCGTDGRIGVRYDSGHIAVIGHVDDLLTGAIGWTD